MKRSTWSLDQPTRAGVYWYRGPDNGDVAQIVRVFRDGTKELSVQYGNIDADTSLPIDDEDDHVDWIVNWRGEWAGPVPMPRERE